MPVQRGAQSCFPGGPNFTQIGGNDTIVEEHADVAQLVEQLIRNQQVVSSSLTVGSIPASAAHASLNHSGASEPNQTPIIHALFTHCSFVSAYPRIFLA